MINPYCTLEELKAWGTTRGQTATIDGIDDAVMESIIEGVSRQIDQYCARTFYPRYETHYLTVPSGQNDNSILFLDDDLLAVVTLTNGNSVALASTEYALKPKNYSPAYALQMIETSAYIWEPTTAGAYENAITLVGWWGFHNKYTQRALISGGTLGAAMADTTTKSCTLTAGHTVKAGDIIKIDSELFNVTAVTATTATFYQRGDNGSTAATHLISSVVYVWQVMPEIKQAVLQTALNIYAGRSGQSSAGQITITASGVIIRPDAIPPMVQKSLDGFVRRL